MQALRRMLRGRSRRRFVRPRSAEHWWAWVDSRFRVRVRVARNGGTETFPCLWCPVTLKPEGWPEEAPHWLYRQVWSEVRRLAERVAVAEVHA